MGSGVAEALLGIRQAGGLVIARYQRTATVRAANGRLLTLHGPDVGLSPFSVALERTPPAWPKLGSLAAATASVLHVGELRLAMGAVGVEMPPARAPGAPTPISPTSIKWNDAVVRVLEAGAAGSAFEVWWRDDERNGAGAVPRSTVAVASEVSATGGAALRSLVRALRRSDGDAAWAAITVLLGLGPGLTPSGDDALAGLFGAWQRLASPLDASLCQQLLRRAAAQAPPATTPVSAEFFFHLARGRLSEQVELLLAAIACGEAPAAASAVDRLGAWGHTSGRDCMAGVLAFLLAAQRKPPAWQTT
jgi:hypothetical protein